MSTRRVDGDSENLVRTGNQQERLKVYNTNHVPIEIGHYLAGFADGEGSFNVSFRPRPDNPLPWKVSLCFNISQKDPVILSLFKRHLRCGTMRQRHDGVWYYEVNNLTPILENVIPFFERFGFLSAKKKRDFAKFKLLAMLFGAGEHKTRQGILKILAIRRDMNDGGKRRYSDEHILEYLENPQRLYAGPSPSEMDETVRPARQRAEPGGNDLVPTKRGSNNDERS